MSDFFNWNVTALEVYQAIMIVAILLIFQWVLGWIFPQVVKAREKVMKASKGIGSLLDYISTPLIGFLIIVGIFISIKELFTTPIALQAYENVRTGANEILATVSGEATTASSGLASVPGWLWGLVPVLVLAGLWVKANKDDDIQKAKK